MKTWQIALLGLASLAVAGCQTDPNNALLERELFQKENEIYQLRDQLEDCRAELQSLRCQKPPRSTPPAAATERGPATTPSTPSSTPPAPEEEKEPSIVLPKQPEPEGKVPERFQVPAQPGNSPPPANSPSPSDSTAPPWKPSTRVSPVDSSRVAEITLNQSLTAGYSTAGSPGQEGVIVVVEPRDARGRLLDAPADLQVVVLDPALSGAGGPGGALGDHRGRSLGAARRRGAARHSLDPPLAGSAADAQPAPPLCPLCDQRRPQAASGRPRGSGLARRPLGGLDACAASRGRAFLRGGGPRRAAARGARAADGQRLIRCRPAASRLVAGSVVRTEESPLPPGATTGVVPEGEGDSNSEFTSPYVVQSSDRSSTSPAWRASHICCKSPHGRFRLGRLPRTTLESLDRQRGLDHRVRAR